MTDKSLIAALLNCNRLTEDEEQAFRGMLNRLDDPKEGTLSPKQRQWANSVYTKYDLTKSKDEPDEVSVSVYAFQKMPLPRKPPGHKCPEGSGLCKSCEPCRKM